MTYDQFVQTVTLTMKEVISDDITVSNYTTEKNNGVKRVGITLSQKNINISPTIYLEEYYEKYEAGYNYEGIIEDILNLYQEVKLKESWNEEQIHRFKNIEGKIIYRLINAEANKKLLSEIPYVPYLNLAIVFYVMLEINEYGTACMLIRKEHLEMWNVSANDVYEKAKDNTWKLLPCEFHTMCEMMEEYKKEEIHTGMEILYVLTNRFRSFGAATILYEGCLEMIADFLEDNFYVLPSSIHEVIVISETNSPWGSAGLSDMVREINRTQVDAEDVLSDYVYYYDREKKKLV